MREVEIEMTLMLPVSVKMMVTFEGDEEDGEADEGVDSNDCNITHVERTSIQHGLSISDCTERMSEEDFREFARLVAKALKERA